MGLVLKAHIVSRLNSRLQLSVLHSEQRPHISVAHKQLLLVLTMAGAAGGLGFRRQVGPHLSLALLAPVATQHPTSVAGQTHTMSPKAAFWDWRTVPWLAWPNPTPVVGSTVVT